MNRCGIVVHECHQTQCLSQLSARLPASFQQRTPLRGTELVLAAATDEAWGRWSGRALRVVTPAFSELRTRTPPVSPYECVNLVLNVGWQGVRHPYPNHARREKRSTFAEQRSLCVHKTNLVESDEWSAVMGGWLVPMRSDSHPSEPAGDRLPARIRAIHTDAQHGIVFPRAHLSHAIMHAEDPALAGITDMRSKIDKHSQWGVLPQRDGQSITLLDEQGARLGTMRTLHSDRRGVHGRGCRPRRRRCLIRYSRAVSVRGGSNPLAPAPARNPVTQDRAEPPQRTSSRQPRCR